MPANCLDHLKTEGWPKDGVLRVEILRPGDVKVPLNDEDMTNKHELSKLRGIHKGGLENIYPSSTLPHEENSRGILTADKIDVNQTISLDEISLTESRLEQNVTPTIEIEVSESTSSTEYVKFTEEAIEMTISERNTKETYNNDTISKINDQAFEELLKSDVPEVEKLMNAVHASDQYIVECKLIVSL